MKKGMLVVLMTLGVSVMLPLPNLAQAQTGVAAAPALTYESIEGRAITKQDIFDALAEKGITVPGWAKNSIPDSGTVGSYMTLVTNFQNMLGISDEQMDDLKQLIVDHFSEQENSSAANGSNSSNSPAQTSTTPASETQSQTSGHASNNTAGASEEAAFSLSDTLKGLGDNGVKLVALRDKSGNIASSDREQAAALAIDSLNKFNDIDLHADDNIKVGTWSFANQYVAWQVFNDPKIEFYNKDGSPKEFTLMVDGQEKKVSLNKATLERITGFIAQHAKIRMYQKRTLSKSDAEAILRDQGVTVPKDVSTLSADSNISVATLLRAVGDKAAKGNMEAGLLDYFLKKDGVTGATTHANAGSASDVTPSDDSTVANGSNSTNTAGQTSTTPATENQTRSSGNTSNHGASNTGQTARRGSLNSRIIKAVSQTIEDVPEATKALVKQTVATAMPTLVPRLRALAAQGNMSIEGIRTAVNVLIEEIKNNSTVLANIRTQLDSTDVAPFVDELLTQLKAQGVISQKMTRAELIPLIRQNGHLTQQMRSHLVNQIQNSAGLRMAVIEAIGDYLQQNPALATAVLTQLETLGVFSDGGFTVGNDFTGLVEAVIPAAGGTCSGA